MITIRRNLKLFPWFFFLRSFRFINVVLVLYYADISGSYALAMTVFTVGLISTSIFEVPTGIISDKYLGRAKTLAVGTFIDGISLLILGFAGYLSSYTLLLLSSIIHGCALSMYSGTDKAFVFETVKELRKTNKFAHIFGRMNSMSQISMAIAGLFGAFLIYKTSYTFVAFISTIPLFLLSFICLFMIEPKKIKSVENESSLYHIKEASKKIWINRKLRKIAIAEILDEVSGQVSYRLQVVFLKSLMPMWAIGIFRSLKQFSGFISFWFAGKIIEKFGPFKTLIGGNIIISFCKITALAINNIFSAGIFSLLNLGYGTGITAQSKIAQEEFTDKQRATMGSLVSFIGSIFFGILAIITGFLVDYFGIIVVLYLLIIPELFVVILYWQMEKDSKKASN